MTKTYMAKPGEIERHWYVVDAQDQVLGRLATQVANILRGKNKPTFTPHVDTGDFVIVVNADKVRLTGKKPLQKQFRWHTMYPGGLKSVSYGKMLQQHPDKVIKRAVWGMLPHNALGRNILRKLKVYAGASHPHQAQKPEPLTLEKRG
ncbi:MAG: 50S ribosomal protein L13 [Firmicutes bacterium]|nr:50S ribosomal protein L13 [Bacillota bacterium]